MRIVTGKSDIVDRDRCCLIHVRIVDYVPQWKQREDAAARRTAAPTALTEVDAPITADAYAGTTWSDKPVAVHAPPSHRTGGSVRYDFAPVIISGDDEAVPEDKPVSDLDIPDSNDFADGGFEGLIPAEEISPQDILARK